MFFCMQNIFLKKCTNKLCMELMGPGQIWIKNYNLGLQVKLEDRPLKGVRLSSQNIWFLT